MSSLNLKLSVRDTKGTDPRIHLHAITRQWLPLATSLLDMVCEALPSPLEVSEERVKNLMCGGFKKFDAYPRKTQLLKEGERDFRKHSLQITILFTLFPYCPQRFFSNGPLDGILDIGGIGLAESHRE